MTPRGYSSLKHAYPVLTSRNWRYEFLKPRSPVSRPDGTRDRQGLPIGLEPTDGNEEALFVGRAPWPAADAHVGPAEDTRNRPTFGVFNGVVYPNFRQLVIAGFSEPSW